MLPRRTLSRYEEEYLPLEYRLGGTSQATSSSTQFENNMTSAAVFPLNVKGSLACHGPFPLIGGLSLRAYLLSKKTSHHV